MSTEKDGSRRCDGTGPESVTVVVTGATGAVGSAAARELTRRLGPGDRLVLLGRDLDRLAELRRGLAAEPGADTSDWPWVSIGELSLPREGVEGPDVTGTLRNACGDASGVPVLLNAVGPSSEVTASLALAALGAGMDVVDPGASERLLGLLDGPARRAGRTVLLGAGVQPGLTGMMLMRAVELCGDPASVRVSLIVGGRQRLTAATLREYLGSLSSDGGWPGAVWDGGMITTDGAREPVSVPGVVLPGHAEVSTHMDEEYVHLARAGRIGCLRAANVMDSPRTVSMVRRWLAGAATEQEVAVTSENEIDDAHGGGGSGPWFAIGLHAAGGRDNGSLGVDARFRCRDSYRVSGEVAAAAVLAVTGRGPVAPAEPGARWASDSPAADLWAEREDISFSVSASGNSDGDTDVDGGVVVVGAGFGTHYARALAGSPETPLTAIVGRGGDAGRRLADELGVRYVTRSGTDDPRQRRYGSPAGAVVAVRSEIVGGDGDRITAELLGSGVPVLQELPVAPAAVSRHLSLAHRHGTRYMVCGLYEYTAPVRRFVAAVGSLRARTTVTHVLVRTSHHVLDRAALILAEALGAVPVGPHSIAATSSPEWRLVSGRWGRVPVDIMLAHRMDPVDPDNSSQPVMTVVVDTADGELSWDGPVSVPRWHQRPHSCAGQLTDPLGATACAWTPDTGGGEVSNWGQVVDQVWPDAVRSAVADLVDSAAPDRTVRDRERRALLVLRWWQDLSAQLPAPARIMSQEPVHLDPPEARV